MRVKLLLMLVLISLEVGAWNSEKSRKARVRSDIRIGNHMKRIPAKFTMETEDINDCLYLTFRFSLNDADITIIDKYGNEVVKEQKSLIYEGRVITIPQSDGYPYSFEITSSKVEIEGEIVLE